MAMGLKSGDAGVKATLRHRYPTAFREVASLLELRVMADVSREATSIAIDGNVLLMNMPHGTFEDTCAYVARAVFSALDVAFTVFVVFDEPECMPKAKFEEQMRRDGAALKKAVKCSADLREPHDDSFTLEQLLGVHDVREVLKHRPARCRLYDIVMARVCEILRPTLASSGADVLIDGMDRRAHERPAGAPREPAIVSAKGNVAIEEVFSHEPEGEGDIKLAVIADTVRELALCRTLHISQTVDTDSLGIGLLECARRRAEQVPSSTCEILAMKSRAKKNADGSYTPGAYVCADMALLHALVLKDMHSMTPHVAFTPIVCRQAITLLVAAFVACGSDYAEVKGMRVDHAFEATAKLMGGAPSTAKLMRGAWSGDLTETKKAVIAVRALVDDCANQLENVPRSRKASVAAMRSADQALLMRIVWVASYWSGHEFEDVGTFGFSLLRG